MMMKCSVLLLLICATLVFATKQGPRWHELHSYTFDQYYQDFYRQYEKGSKEYKYKEKIFNDKLADIRRHNADARNTFKRGVNQFSDWTEAEFQRYNKFKLPKQNERSETEKFYASKDGQLHLPAEVDYRTWTSPRVLTGVKNQGACGNCWAHSCIESLESFYALKTRQLPVLSTQQVTSCTLSMYGCGGGDYIAGWQYIQNSTGLNEEWLYPFVDFFAKSESMNGTQPCYNLTKKFLPYFPWWPKANVSGIVQVEPNSAESAMEALAVRGPQSIAVAAAAGWSDYESGIFFNNYSNPLVWQIDHAVQLVGYGHDDDFGMDYWVVRNSWGTEWGEDGFIRLYRPPKGEEPCGFAQGSKICGTSGLLCMPAHPYASTLKKKNI